MANRVKSTAKWFLGRGALGSEWVRSVWEEASDGSYPLCQAEKPYTELLQSAPTK